MYLFCICKIRSLDLGWGASILTGIFHFSSVYSDKWQDNTCASATTASFQSHPFASYLVLNSLSCSINKFINIQGQFAADREFVAVWWFIVTKQMIQNCHCWIWSRKFFKQSISDSGTAVLLVVTMRCSSGYKVISRELFLAFYSCFNIE